jgi:hypothetical protein
MAQASANILAPQLHHNQARRLIQDLFVGIAALRRSFGPVLFNGAHNLLYSRRISPAMGNDHHGQRTIRKSRQPIPPLRKKFQPPCRSRASRKVTLHCLSERCFFRRHRTTL